MRNYDLFKFYTLFQLWIVLVAYLSKSMRHHEIAASVLREKSVFKLFKANKDPEQTV